MTDLDFYYRALLDYRNVTQENHGCTSFSNAIARSNPDQDKVLITRHICVVEEDWIKAIEDGLVFVEKAIREERQFIHSQGEVLEIEKVRHISPESVRHLARHSNLITREQEDDSIIPDKLYSVERLSDYAVYENRFLYMLLCYLRDFVTLRYNKILELSNKYDGLLQMNKQLDLPKQKLTCSISLHDQRQDDPFLREHNGAQQTIDRINLILNAIIALLSTPLMEITGKSPMLKPPITKTNVLKMDNNFRGAVALYDFIIAYDKPGYTITDRLVNLSPFDDTLAGEMADAVALLSYLTYANGLDLRDILKSNYDARQAELATEEQQKLQQQAHALQRRLAAMEIPVEEYIAAIEKENRLLEKENRQMQPLHNRLQQISDENCRLSARYDTARADADLAHEKLETIEQDLRAEFQLVKDSYDERIYQMLIQHESETKALEQEMRRRMEDLQLQHAKQTQALEEEMRNRVDALNTQIRETAEKAEAQILNANSQLSAAQAELKQLLLDYETLTEEKDLCLAQMKALRISQGDLLEGEDFTDQLPFEQLEREFQAFAKFYQKNWSKTKKKIRSQLLNYKYLKGLNGQ